MSDHGSFNYNPYDGFTGRDWFTWQVKDGDKQGDYATVFIDVEPAAAAVTLTVGDASDPAPPD